MWSKRNSHSLLAGMQYTQSSPSGRLLLTQLNILLPQDPATALLDIYPRELNTYVTQTYFTAALLSFHSNPKEGQCWRMFKLPHNCTHFTLIYCCERSQSEKVPAIWTNYMTFWKTQNCWDTKRSVAVRTGGWRDIGWNDRAQTKFLGQ